MWFSDSRRNRYTFCPNDVRYEKESENVHYIYDTDIFFMHNDREDKYWNYISLKKIFYFDKINESGYQRLNRLAIQRIFEWEKI